MPKFLKVFAAAAVLLALNANVNADTVLDLVEVGNNEASDEDREYLIDRVITAVGQVDVGDSFRGHINFNTINSTSANLGGLTGNSELSGIFQAIVTSIVVTPLGGGAFFVSATFGPDPVFEAEFGTPGAMVVLFDDSTPDFAADFTDPGAPVAIDDGTPGRTVPPSSADVSTGLNASEEAFIATALDGSRFITLGFTGPRVGGIVTPAAGEGAAIADIIDTPTLNVLSFFGLTSGSTFVSANLGLNRLDGPGAEIADVLEFGKSPAGFGGPGADFAVSTDLRGVRNLDTPFEISTNTNAAFLVTAIIPEPGSMILLGMGAAGMFGARFRRRKATRAQQQAV